MTADHHDAELCKRLALNVMGWKLKPNSAYPQKKEAEKHGRFVDHTGKHVIWRNRWNPCCNPAHSWMLEQKMADLGWEYQAFQGAARFFKGTDDGPLFEAANRLASTAVAADEVTK